MTLQGYQPTLARMYTNDYYSNAENSGKIRRFTIVLDENANAMKSLTLETIKRSGNFNPGEFDLSKVDDQAAANGTDMKDINKAFDKFNFQLPPALPFTVSIQRDGDYFRVRGVCDVNLLPGGQLTNALDHLEDLQYYEEQFQACMQAVNAAKPADDDHFFDDIPRWPSAFVGIHNRTGQHPLPPRQIRHGTLPLLQSQEDLAHLQSPQGILSAQQPVEPLPSRQRRPPFEIAAFEQLETPLDGSAIHAMAENHQTKAVSEKSRIHIAWRLRDGDPLQEAPMLQWHTIEATNVCGKAACVNPVVAAASSTNGDFTKTARGAVVWQQGLAKFNDESTRYIDGSLMLRRHHFFNSVFVMMTLKQDVNNQDKGASVVYISVSPPTIRCASDTP